MAHYIQAHLVCLFVCLFVCIREGVSQLNTSDVLGNILAYCPLHQSCDGENIHDRNESSLRFDGCCLHCDCSDACFVTGNCCPGKQPKNGSNALKQCVQTYVKYQQSIRMSQIYTNASYILNLFDTADQCEFNISEKCLSPNVSSLSENTPVYVKSRKVNYRNVFCAKCDGINEADNIVSWPTQIACDTYNSDVLRLLFRRNGETDFQIIKRLRNDQCSLYWNPVEPDETRRCIHESDIVSTCLDNRNKQFQIDQCESDHHTLHAPFFYFNALWKNIYCADCNFGLRPKETIQCDLNLGPATTGFVTLLDSSAYGLQDSVGRCLPFNVVSQKFI